MTTATRIARLEALAGRDGLPVAIVAVDQLDFDRQFEDMLLSQHPGPLSLEITIAGVKSWWSGIIPTHEERLAELSG